MTSHDSETPAHGHQVITACAFIHRQVEGLHQVFLPKRAATKKFLPNVYELPGGHIEFGEDPVTGLKREILEEFQAEISVGDPFYVFTYTNHIKGSHSIEVIYFAQFKNSNQEIRLNPQDHSTYGWFSKHELSTLTSNNKTADDPEFQGMSRAFELLQDKSIRFS